MQMGPSNQCLCNFTTWIRRKYISFFSIHFVTQEIKMNLCNVSRKYQEVWFYAKTFNSNIRLGKGDD